MKNKERKVTMKEVNENRHKGHKVYGTKKAYCDLMDCCDYCNCRIRFLCKVISKIEEHQSKIVKKICK